MLLGLDPAYRGQDERLDRRVLFLALAVIGAGAAFLLAVMFLSFPEWINPRTFAAKVLSAVRNDVWSGPAYVHPAPAIFPSALVSGPVPVVQRVGALDDRVAGDDGNDPVASVDGILESGRGILAEALRPSTATNPLPIEARSEPDAACFPGSVDCVASMGTISRPARDADSPGEPVEPAVEPVIAAPPAPDPVPVTEPPPSPGQPPPIVPPGQQTPGSPPGPPIMPPGQTPGVRPAPPITPPGKQPGNPPISPPGRP